MSQATQSDKRYPDIPMDLHTHTWHSPDATQQTVEDRIRAAEKMQLRIMAVTDHVEINRWYPAEHYHAEETEEFLYDSARVYEGSVSETLTARANNAGSPVKVLCGSEVGQIPQAPELARAVYDDPRLDIVIGSVHELPGMPDFYFLDYGSLSIPLLLGMYFEEELRLAASGSFDTLGHLTYALRYIPDRFGYDLTQHYPVIDEIFRTLIANGKALELNGSGLKSAVPFTDPDLTLLRRYRQLGGELLTIGSDAHDTKHLAYGMSQLLRMASDAGFSNLTYFEKHQPRLIPLVL